jgi:DNA-directed RNA polymerase specialized sigma54-like protein
MAPPRLLVLKSLLEPSVHAQQMLKEIEDKLANTPSESIELKGFFVLMVSAPGACPSNHRERLGFRLPQ